MSHTELTDEPCPECGASLDLMVTPPEGVPALGEGSPDLRKTVQLSRVKVCPDCGWHPSTQAIELIHLFPSSFENSP